MRVEKPLFHLGQHELKTVLDLRHFKEKSSPPAAEKNALMTIKLFLETPEPSSDSVRALLPSELLVFVKLYEPKLRKLSYVGHLFVEKSRQFRLIFEKARKLAGLPYEVDIVGYEEVKYDPTVMISDLPPSQTPEKVK